MPSEGGTGSAEAPAAAAAVAQHSPSPTSTSQGADSAAITTPSASSPSPPGDPAPPTALPPSGRVSTRTRRRTAAAAGVTPRAVDYGLGSGGALGHPHGVLTPPRVPRPQQPLAAVTAPAPADSSAPTVPIPSGRDHAELVGTLFLRLPPPPNVPSATTADLDALGTAGELLFGDSAACYSHADWAREEQAEPAYHAATCHIVLGRPPSLPADFLSCFPSHHRPSFSESQELAGEGRPHSTDDGIVLLVRQPTPQPPSDSQRPVGRAACLLNDEHVRFYIPLLMRP